MFDEKKLIKKNFTIIHHPLAMIGAGGRTKKILTAPLLLTKWGEKKRGQFFHSYIRNCIVSVERKKVSLFLPILNSYRAQNKKLFFTPISVFFLGQQRRLQKFNLIKEKESFYFSLSLYIQTGLAFIGNYCTQKESNTTQYYMYIHCFPSTELHGKG